MPRSKLTHVDDAGRARMVDVGDKAPVTRLARAHGRIRLKATTISLIAENAIKKGDVLAVAEIAGIQAAKRAAELIPLCHPLPLTRVSVVARLEDKTVVVIAEAKCVGRTGVEMEALTAVSVALLSIYDMCKAVDDEMEIGEIQLLEKRKSAPLHP